MISCQISTLFFGFSMGGAIILHYMALHGGNRKLIGSLYRRSAVGAIPAKYGWSKTDFKAEQFQSLFGTTTIPDGVTVYPFLKSSSKS